MTPAYFLTLFVLLAILALAAYIRQRAELSATLGLVLVQFDELVEPEPDRLVAGV